MGVQLSLEDPAQLSLALAVGKDVQREVDSIQRGIAVTSTEPPNSLMATKVLRARRFFHGAVVLALTGSIATALSWAWGSGFTPGEFGNELSERGLNR